MRLPTGFAAWATGFALIGWITCGGARPAYAVEIAISCGAVGNALELCKQGAEAWAKKTGNSVQVISTPNSTTERLALYQQLLAAGSSLVSGADQTSAGVPMAASVAPAVSVSGGPIEDVYWARCRNCRRHWVGSRHWGAPRAWGTGSGMRSRSAVAGAGAQRIGGSV